jgi:signal transduction histidine kinase
MEANKPSYEELADQVAVLKEKLVSLSLLLSETYNEPRVVSDSSENEKSVETQSLNTELIGTVLRKIKTPLDTIIGLANLLSTSKLEDAERSNFAKIIANCSGELQVIFSEFVSYTSFESQKETLDIKKVSLNEVLEELKIKLVGQVLHKGLNLRFSKGLSNGNDAVLIDRAKITQVFASLLSNSLKFTNMGFIEIGYQLVNNEIEFYVKDSGVGLEKNFKEKLLTSQFKLEKITETENKVGLGLSTAKRYVDLLGGVLKVESELGVGTTFYFSVPFVPVLPEIKQAAPEKTIKVLIAEDEEISYLLLKTLLEKGNVQIIRAKNGVEAYEIYKNNPDINLILMDIRMPQVDGYTAAQLIKNEAPEIPIIAQSAYFVDADKEQYSKAFNGFLSKPVDKEAFQQAVNKYIDVAFLN